MRTIYDEKLAQAAYLFGCQRTGEAIVIDPARDVDRYIDLARDNGLSIVATAETHIHADFVSGCRELAERVDAKVYVSNEGGPDWKSEWLEQKVGGGTYRYKKLHDGDVFAVGHIEFRVVHTPGHTPEHIAFLVTDRGGGADEPLGLASGDFVFVGDLGRPDLLESAAGQAGAMEPSARQLFQTVRKLDAIPDFVQVWPAHGAGSACGKALGAVPMSTIGYERRFNPAIRAADNEADFVDFILSGQPEPPLYFANMKRVNRVGPNVLGGVPTPAELTVAELRALDAKRVALVDTRPWDEFRVGHVPGAMSFPLRKTFNTDAGSMVAETDDIYVVIEPDRLDEAVRDLIRIGLDHNRGWFDARNMADYESDTYSLRMIAEVGVADATAMLDDRQVTVLDVRRAAEFADGHLRGATNIAHTRLASRLDEVPGGPLLVQCRTGIRSARAAAFLQKKGFDVVNLRGGIVAWEQANGAIETPETR